MRAVLRLLLCCGVVGVSLFRPAYAQRTSLVARVVYIAAQDVYVDAGTDAGLVTGDTLEVRIDGEVRGRFRVLSSSDSRAVLTFADEPFAVTRGQRLRLLSTARARTESAPEVPAPEVSREDDRPSILEDTGLDRTAPQEVRRRLKVSGRLTLGLAALRSETEGLSGRRTRRFNSPTVGLRAHVANLPGDAQLTVDMRATYRMSSDDLIMPAALVRVYETSLKRTVDAVELTAGRFRIPYQSVGGFWDGFLIGYHAGGLRLGVAVGLEPHRANAAFSTDLPKYAVVGSYEHRTRKAAYLASVSLNSVRPRNHLLTHTFVTASHRIRWRGARLNQSLSVDRDPISGGMVVSLLHNRGSIRVGRPIEVHGRYDVHQPYAFWRTTEVMPYRTERFGGGVSLTVPPVRLGADVTWSEPDVGASSRTVASSLFISDVGLWKIGLNASGSWWEGSLATARYATAGLYRRFGGLDVRASYAFFRTDLGTSVVDMHTGTGSFGMRLTRQVQGYLSIRSTFGEQLRSTSLYSSVRVVF